MDEFLSGILGMECVAALLRDDEILRSGPLPTPVPPPTPAADAPGGEVFVFADGACIRNGKPGAVAAWGVCARRGALTLCELAGRVPGPRGSNNRGELLGVGHALRLLKALNADWPSGSGPLRAVVVSDSLITVRTLNEWYPTRLRKGTENEFKNLDLVAEAYGLLIEVRAAGAAVHVLHVRGHQRVGAVPEALRLGNERADALATGAIHGATPCRSFLPELDKFVRSYIRDEIPVRCGAAGAGAGDAVPAQPRGDS